MFLNWTWLLLRCYYCGELSSGSASLEGLLRLLHQQGRSRLLHQWGGSRLAQRGHAPFAHWGQQSFVVGRVGLWEILPLRFLHHPFLKIARCLESSVCLSAETSRCLGLTCYLLCFGEYAWLKLELFTVRSCLYISIDRLLYALLSSAVIRIKVEPFRDQPARPISLRSHISRFAQICNRILALCAHIDSKSHFIDGGIIVLGIGGGNRVLRDKIFAVLNVARTGVASRPARPPVLVDRRFVRAVFFFFELLSLLSREL